MTSHPQRAWPAAVAVGLLAIVVFAALIILSNTLRHYWPFLLLSAGTAAALVLIRNPATEPQPSLPWFPTNDRYLPEASAPAVLRACAVTVPRASAANSENEDAYAIDTATGYVAIADGASSSFQATDWARTLCDAFLAQQPLHGRPSPAWIKEAATAFARLADSGSDWWSVQAAQRGAHAAFAGLAVAHTEQGLGWRAMAIGDCVLVHLRQDHRGPIATFFPIAHSASFPQNPALLSSIAEEYPPIASIEGAASIGDVWLLMTDELARWALRRYECGDPVWKELSGGDEADIRALIERARADHGVESGEVADDDMTIVSCEVMPAN